MADRTADRAAGDGAGRRAGRPDTDPSVVLAAGYGATVVIGVIAGRWIRADSP
ncbi:MAG: hypothetical protein VB138_14555 [Burkholderia sp.]